MSRWNPDKALVLQLPFEVNRGRIADLLCCALEGGSTYWCQRVEITDFPEGAEWAHEAIASGLTEYTVTTWEDGEFTVGGTVPEALRKLAREYPHQWDLFMCEQEDADTGDLFFQLCVFGEVIYG